MANKKNRDSACIRDNLIVIVTLIMIASLLFFGISCGPSHKDQQAKKEAENKKLVLEVENKEKILIDSILKKYDAVYFPPENLSATPFTYEIQTFFEKHSRKSIVFKGYLDDIEKVEKAIIVKFSCLLGENYLPSNNDICFRLSISEGLVKQFLIKKREDYLSPLLRFIYGPNYYVVVKIDDIKKNYLYTFNGTASGEEVEIEPNVSNNLVSTGKFIDVIPIIEPELKLFQ